MAWITGAFQRQSKNVSFWNGCFHLRIISVLFLFFHYLYCWSGLICSLKSVYVEKVVVIPGKDTWRGATLLGRLRHVLLLGRLCCSKEGLSAFRSLSLRRPHPEARWLRSWRMCDEKRWLRFGESSAWYRRESILFPPGRVTSHCLIPGLRSRRPEEVVRPCSQSRFDRWCYKSSLTDFGNSGGRKGSRVSAARSSWWQLPKG